MTLRLKDIGTTGESPGERTVESGEVLRIGRAHENDWVLADPTCQISKRHCAISFEDGHFVLTDFSTNGVFFGDETMPVGRGATRPLAGGQTLQISTYRFAVTIDPEPTSPRADAEANAPALSVSTILDGTTPSSTARASASLALPSEEWLVSTVPAGAYARANASRPVGWDAPPDTMTFAAQQRGSFAEVSPAGFTDHSERAAAVNTVVRLPETQPMLPPDWNDTSLPGLGAGDSNIAVLRPASPSTHRSGTKQRLVPAFLDGAGLPADALDGVNQEAALREAGRILRIAIEGARTLLRCGLLFETELRVEQMPPDAFHSEALKFSGDARSALRTMIGAPTPGTTSGAEAMSGSFTEINAREVALVGAIGEVLAKIAAELDPPSIKATVDAGRKPLLSRAQKARYWDAFEAHYAALRSGADSTESLADLSTRLFAEAYARRLRDA